MGYNNDQARRIVIDIETAPLDDAANYIEPATAPANYKDPAKIAAFIEDKTAENLATCSLDVDLCRIVAIGMQHEGDEPWGAVVTEPVAEMTLLRNFWTAIGDRYLVGFNILGFDLPVLLRRSLYLGVDAPAIQIDRFKHPQVTDLMQTLSFDGKLRMRSLAFYCKRFGIDVPDTLTGANIAQAVKDGDWNGIEHHVKADVQKTALLAAKLGAFHLAANEVPF